jgi:hypothetical protein
MERQFQQWQLQQQLRASGSLLVLFNVSALKQYQNKQA